MSGTGGHLGRLERPLAAPAIAPADISALVAEPLERVERCFRENLASAVGIIDEIGGYVRDGGGKRVRPTLHLLCSRLCGYDGPHDVLLATVLEFIHSATLIHDDIIDEATTRRGRASVNHRWGNNVTVLFGDYLYAKAMEMALEAGSLRVMQTLSDITLRMTEGEMLQTRYVGRIDLTVEEHLDLIDRKTAGLFGGSCRLAAMLGGVDAEDEAALERFGRNLGMAFQIVDDLLDFTGDAKTLGKPAASDLREGKVTLALIELLAEGSSEARRLAESVMRSGQPDMPEIGALTDLLRASGALERAHRRAQRHASLAVRELDRFPEGPYRRALRAVPDLLLFRDR